MDKRISSILHFSYFVPILYFHLLALVLYHRHIEAQLETGRTHQIRVHMAYIKHPLIGDSTYGPKKQPFGVEGQLLHAKILGFVHPRTGEYMEFERPRPEIFEKTLKKLRG